MMSTHVNISTRSHDYGEPESYKAKTTTDVSEPLHIESPIVDSIPQIPKGFAKCSTINPNGKETQKCPIVEDMAHCAMLALEVL